MISVYLNTIPVEVRATDSLKRLTGMGWSEARRSIVHFEMHHNVILDTVDMCNELSDVIPHAYCRTFSFQG